MVRSVSHESSEVVLKIEIAECENFSIFMDLSLCCSNVETMGEATLFDKSSNKHLLVRQNVSPMPSWPIACTHKPWGAG